MKKKLLTLLAFVLFFSANTFSQTTIVIPFYKQGENKVAIIEEDPCYRKVETSIKGLALKEADFQLIDYLAIVRKIGKDRIRPYPPGDIIKLIVEEADPDIYIVADIENYRGRSSMNGKTEYAIRINLTSHQPNTGRTCAATILDSGRRYYSDCHSLIQKAFLNKDETDARKIEVFLQQLVTCMDKSKSVSIKFFVAESSGSKYTDKLTNGELLVREIINWVKKNSKNHKAKSSFSPTIIDFREILVPNGQSTADYALDLYSYLTGLPFGTGENLEFEFDVSGNTITFTLQ